MEIEEKVENLTEKVVDLTAVVKVNAQRSARDAKLVINQRRILSLVAIGVVILVVLGAVVAVIAVQNRYSNAQIHDCLTSGSTCFDRNADQTEALVTSISYRSEYERLTTEIQVAEAKGDMVAVQVRTQRRNDVLQLLKSNDALVADIQRGIDPSTDPAARAALVSPQDVPVP